MSVLVLTYNASTLLPNCLTALQQVVDEETEIIVVDNASAESPRKLLNQNFPKIHLIENPSNVGYGGGNNVGIRQCTDEFVVLVNPDVVVSADFLPNLLAPFAEPTIGIVGAKLHYPHGNAIQHAGGYLTAPRALPNHFGIGEKDDGQYDTPREVEYVIGAAIALRRAMLDEIGLFDEDYFLFFEEVDLCYRARAAGWKVWYEPAAVATHIESATVGKHSFFYYQQFHKSRLQFVAKHYSEEQFSVLVTAETLELANVSNLERLAMQLAYQHLLAKTKSEFLRAGLTQLHKVALQPAELPQLPSAEISPHTFRAKWSLLARLRDLWSRVAVRPYAEAHFAQQSEFNRIVAEKIVQNDRQIEQQRAEMGRISAEITQMQNQLK